MAKADINKFRELLLSDADFQEKIRKASEEYTGEKDEKAVFDNLLTPLAKEYGLSATYEEFSAYVDGLAAGAESELSEDELAQIAGGKGSGAFVCVIFGGGAGSTNDKDWCAIIGLGLGICMVEGVSA